MNSFYGENRVHSTGTNRFVLWLSPVAPLFVTGGSFGVSSLPSSFLVFPLQIDRGPCVFVPLLRRCGVAVLLRCCLFWTVRLQIAAAFASQ